MEGLVDPDYWQDRRVLVTGHTGFKGAWLCQWLLDMGAQVSGYALSPATPSLHRALALAGRISETFHDITDPARIAAFVEHSNPQVIFHLAAQSLVRQGYNDPVRTFATNVGGTANLLEALRQLGGERQIVIVTSDKCYRNDDSPDHAFSESDPLGGKDPYSASKAAQELVTRSYQQSYFAGTAIHCASARAGNVIGGGDWAQDRLIPDLIRAWQADQPLEIRNPDAIRPWQHVLEPLQGYLVLAQQLASDSTLESFNFGPATDSACSVATLVKLAQRQHPGFRYRVTDETGPREAMYLQLDASLARHELGWHPRLSTEAAVAMTVDWYLRAHEGDNMRAFTSEQIRDYGQ